MDNFTYEIRSNYTHTDVRLDRIAALTRESRRGYPDPETVRYELQILLENTSEPIRLTFDSKEEFLEAHAELREAWHEYLAEERRRAQE